MPTVDLETLMSACAGGSSDNKVTCETTARNLPPPPPDENLPPESFWLSKDAEFDWLDQNASFDRTESLKMNSNSGPISSSQRYSVSAKTKRSFIGLPKTQKTSYIENRKKVSNKSARVKLFPKRTSSMDKPAVQLPEPSSPKVSCIGRVRSKRKNRRKGELVEKDRTSKGILKQLKAMFRSDRRCKPANTCNEPVSEPKPAEFCSRLKVTVQTGGSESEPPGLGAMKVFASGRRSSSAAADLAG